MGVVYQALDTRLNRPVAVKVVREARLLDPDATARFRSEALAAASLDHPYICKVYELIESPNSALLVMEFVEGETLAALLGRGRPPLALTLRIVTEIAEGLANAHAVGLVHRDIKPSNVMLTRHGHVKLLDFGLARPEIAGGVDSITRPSAHHGDDHAGTPRYMSPEQAEGESVTARADIFSLGVVAFECLTGELPFTGATEYTYLHSVVHDAPKSLEVLAPETPGDLVRLVGRCLSKAPGKRTESAAAVAQQLRQIAEASAAPAEHLTQAATLRRSRNRWAVASLVATASIALAVIFWRPSSTGDAEFRQQALVTWPSEESGSVISPDGQWVSFLSDRDGEKTLFAQPSDGSGDAKAVTRPAGEIVSHIWSSDGSKFACAMRRRAGFFLEVIPAPKGGTPDRSLAIGPLDSLALLRWIGNSVYFQTDVRNRTILRRADLVQGTIAEVSDLWKFAQAPLQSGVLRGFDVDWSGRRVVFVSRTDDRTDLWTVNVDGSSPRRLTYDTHIERLPMWTGPDTVLFQSVRGGQVDLWESSVSAGWTRQRTTDWTQEEPESASNDGAVMTFQQVSDNADLWLAERARSAVQLTAEATTDFSPSVSVDGGTLVFQRSQPSPTGRFVETNTWLMKATLDRGRVVVDPLPIETGASVPLVSPDGSRVAFLHESQPGPRLLKTLKIRHLQTGSVVTVSTKCTLPVIGRLQWGSWPMQWTPDGRALVFVEQSDGRLMVKQHLVDSGKDNVRLADVTDDETNSRIRGVFPTADGRFVDYLHWSGGTRYAVRRVERESRQDSELAKIDGAAGFSFQSVTVAGRSAQGSLILLRRLPSTGTLSTVEVLEVREDGRIRSIRVVTNVVERMGHVDVARPLLYLVCASRLVKNVFSISLETGDMRQVTDNQAPNVSFSGVTSLVDGSLIFVRNLGTQDIWLLRRAR
jgi:serine/threonine protein kinase